MAADEVGLTGAWIEGQKHFASTLPREHVQKETETLTQAKNWLDIYLSGMEPNFTPPLNPQGTPFRKAIWEILLRIPYGQTVTYGEIAKVFAQEKGLAKMSTQAVGGAVGHNPISLVIPCHRVVGANGSLTGYAGGIERKQKLLELERNVRQIWVL